MTHPYIHQAIKYLRDRNFKIPLGILTAVKDAGYDLTKEENLERIKAIKSGSIHSRELKQADDYGALRDTLWIEIFDAVFDYLNGDLSINAARSKASLAISDAYINTADTGYVDGGGDLPLDDDTASWAKSQLDAQLAFMDSLFTTLKGLKKEGEFDANEIAADHADGYTSSLDGLYNGAMMHGAGNKMLTMTGTDGKVSCSDCQKYNGERHRASWWISHGVIGPPFRGFECGGWECQHYFIDDNGDYFSV